MSHGTRKTKEVKRFAFYSIYAWGFPIAVTLVTYFLDTYRPDFIHEKFFPNIGEASCWFGLLSDVKFPLEFQVSFPQKIHHPDI